MMKISHLFTSVFSSRDTEKELYIQQFSEPNVLGKLFAFLNTLIVEPVLHERLAQMYQQLTSLSAERKELESIKLYKRYEEFLVENKPPRTQREYTVASLREEIASVISLAQLSEAFQLFFLPDNQKVLVLFKLIMPHVKQNMMSAIGKDSWGALIEHITRGSIFEGTFASSADGSLPQTVALQLENLPLKDLLTTIGSFYETMYLQVSEILGVEQAQEPFRKLYNFVKVSFPYDVTSLLLDLLPSEIFEDERTEIKSRKELEKIIQEKTFQLENAKALLEEKVAEFQKQNQKLEDIKRSMLSLLEDIQEEKDKTEEEKARDDALLESIGDGMIATDRENNIILVNRQAERLLGWTKDELIGKYLPSAIPLVYENGDQLPIPERPSSISLATGRQYSASTITKKTLYYVRKDRTKFPIVTTSTPVIAGNSIIGTTIIFSDATREREVDRMKTEFISLASHQLRTPLSAIKWFGEMLLAGDAGNLTSEQEEFIKNINISTERMIELVDSLLNISRIESGRIVVDPQPTNLKDLVESILTELKVKIQEKHQNMVVTVSGDLPNITIDARLIRQVYLNLLTNAIKYSRPGSDISISLSKQGEEIFSQVSDNGYGIPKEQQGKIFQKFFRAENAVKIETDGTGLGLYLAKAIIESSNGRIWFESEEGKGTSFYFTLPVSGMKPKAGEVTLD